MPKRVAKSAEVIRLAEDSGRRANWKRWGPYLSERQWGTTREDYSADGDTWRYFTHEHARSRAYRWGEDGLMGLTDRECRLCFSVALWNERDPFLKERLFGLTGPEGNHGEDVKECYFYLDSTPTHSWMRALYKYPQAEFPYQKLRDENARRGRGEPEYELLDTGIFDGDRYFDVFTEYAKASQEDICIRITVANRGPDAAALQVLPTLWFRNTWSWNCRHEGEVKPQLRQIPDGRVECDHATLGRFYFEVDDDAGGGGPAEMMFTENESNVQRLFETPNSSPYVKDAFHDYVVDGREEAINPQKVGTKCAARFRVVLAPGEERTLRIRLYADQSEPGEPFGTDFERVMKTRFEEAEQFYAELIAGENVYETRGPFGADDVEQLKIQVKAGEERRPGVSMLNSDEAKKIARQAYAGLLWSKQFYHYIVEDWLEGDPSQPAPPPERWAGRNRDWPHLYSRDILSMPDKWEYPWFAAWDLSFHMIPFARIDPHFAKDQLNLMLREWYMHPNGQIPAYEWNFSDVNPPVHAWSCWRVYKMTSPRGQRDRVWLARVFQKLLMNFTWWVNRKDPDGRHIFSGGFLGLDNIGVFDRSKPLPSGGSLSQADGTAWMAFYCGTMLSIALELAEGDPAYEDIASKFFEHFVAIADAVNHLGGTGLWNEEDGFYYDQLTLDGHTTSVRLRSIVGIIPLFAVELIDEARMDKLPGFAKRTRWFLKNRRDLAKEISYLEERGGRQYLLAIPSRERLERVLRYAFDEKEFLSPYGIRSLSRVYDEQPFELTSGDNNWRVRYTPGESDSGLFGGNSNWRGPVWFPLNYLLIESLERYHHFYGDSFMVEFPTGSGHRMNLAQVAKELSRRLVGLFVPNGGGRTPSQGMDPRFVNDPHWQEYLWFYEYFHGDTGQGLGASHQTGWTALVTRLIENLAKG